jgi:hypothetical protein
MTTPTTVPGALVTLAWVACGFGAQGNARAGVDWLVVPTREAAEVVKLPAKKAILLTNGLISRTFHTVPNFVTVDYTNLATGARVIRGVKPEAVVVLDGRRFEVGGLKGQPDYAYLDPAWLSRMTSDPKAFQFTGFTVGRPQARYSWQPKRHAPNVPWPPKGVTLTATFQPPEDVRVRYNGLAVSVNYELYDAIPVLSKWVTVANDGTAVVALDGLEGEILAVTEDQKPRLDVESNYAFNTMVTTHWLIDPDYPTQVDYTCQSPILMTSKYPRGPGVRLKPGEAFESFRTYTLLYDSDDRERRGLARRRMYRTLAPQVLENPVFMHVRSSEPKAVRLAIDQCAEVGFEMVILTFGSGFNIESEDPGYVAAFKALVDYAHGKGVEVGGYTLMCASRDVGPENDCISPQTGKPGSMFGQSACLATEWADGYFRRVLNFMQATAMDMIETDGPYHGDVCASTTHKHHRGLDDSQFRQWQACCGFYQRCRELGIFVNTPDWYYLNGSNKCAMGYKETNFSLPRWRQILISRQNIYDGTFEKTPSMGWMFVPLVEYHGGGAAATFEPLSQHLKEFEWHLAQNFGSGVQACYRGPRLYDSDQTKAVVKKWVDFYKKYRTILDSDIIHVRRADGRGVDCMMHVNPQGSQKALAMVYNPTDAEIATTFRLPLYYSGLTDKAMIREQEAASAEYTLDRAYDVNVPVKLGPKGITWFVVE